MGLWFALICWGSCIGWFTSRFVWDYGGLLLRVVVSCVVWVGSGWSWRGCCVAWVCEFCLLLIGIRAIGLVVLSGCWCACCCLIWWC